MSGVATHPLEPGCVPHHSVPVVRHREVIYGAGVGNKNSEIAGISGGSTEPQVIGGALRTGVHAVEHVARIRVAGTLVGVGWVAAVTHVLGGALGGGASVARQTRLVVGVGRLQTVRGTVRPRRRLTGRRVTGVLIGV